jgi:hypothetical protein
VFQPTPLRSPSVPDRWRPPLWLRAWDCCTQEIILSRCREQAATVSRPLVTPPQTRFPEHFSRGTEAIGRGQPRSYRCLPSERRDMTRRRPSPGSAATAEARLGRSHRGMKRSGQRVAGAALPRERGVTHAIVNDADEWRQRHVRRKRGQPIIAAGGFSIEVPGEQGWLCRVQSIPKYLSSAGARSD